MKLCVFVAHEIVRGVDYFTIYYGDPQQYGDLQQQPVPWRNVWISFRQRRA